MRKRRDKVIRTRTVNWFDSDLDLEVRMSSIKSFSLYSRNYKRELWIGYIDQLERFYKLIRTALKEYKKIPGGIYELLPESRSSTKKSNTQSSSKRRNKR